MQDMSSNDASAAVRHAIRHLRALKRTASSASDEEEKHLRNTRTRIQFSARKPATGDDGPAKLLSLAEPTSRDGLTGCSPSTLSSNDADGNDRVLDELLIEYLKQQQGMDAIATELANESGLPQALISSPAGAELRGLLSSLQQRETGPALEWCETHRGKLTKHKSPLEALLRLRAFATLVSSDQLLEAVAYARAHFPFMDANHTKLIREAMGALAVPAASRDSCAFFCRSRWTNVIQEMKEVCQHGTKSCPTSRSRAMH